MQYEQVHSMVDTIFALYEEYGNKAYNGNATMLMHMMKCAQMVEAEGYDDEMVVAAFLHDIGPFLQIAGHDKVVSMYLQELGFTGKIVNIISGNIPAKRYVQLSQWNEAAKDPGTQVCREDIARMKEITARYLISQLESPMAYV